MLVRVVSLILFNLFGYFCFSSFAVQPGKRQQAMAFYNKAEHLMNIAEYDSALSLYISASQIFNKSGREREYILCILKQSEIKYWQTDYAKEESLLFQVKSYTDHNRFNDLDVTSRLYYCESLILTAKGNYQESINKLNDCVAIRKNLSGKPDSITILCYIQQGLDYFWLSNYTNAHSLWEKALQLKLEGNKKPDLETARIYGNIGNIYLMNREFDQALDYFNKDNDINQTILKKDNIVFIYNHLNLSNIHQTIGSNVEALRHLKFAEQMAKNKFGDNSLFLAKIYLSISTILINNQEPMKAIKYLDNILSIYKINHFNNPFDVSYIYFFLGDSYLWTNNYTTAANYYNQCIILRKQNNLDNDYQPYFNLAISLLSIHKMAEANINFTKAISLAKKNLGKNNNTIAYLYRYYGSFWLKKNNSKKAYYYLSKSYKIFYSNKEFKNLYFSESLREFGNYYIKINEPNKALQYFQQSLIALLPTFNDTSIIENPPINVVNISRRNCLNDNWLLRSLACKANALEMLATKQANRQMKLRLLKTALQCREQCVLLVENMRSGFASEESRLQITSYESNSFTAALETTLQLYNITGDIAYAGRAFNYAERGKAANLLSALRSSNATHFANVPDSVLEEEKNLQSNIAFYDNQSIKERQKPKPDTAQIRKWENKSFGILRKQENFIADIKHRYPDYFNLKFSNKVEDIGSIQKKLGDDEAMLEYAFSGKQLAVFAISKHNFKIFTTPADDILSSDIEGLHQFLSMDNFKSFALAPYQSYQKTAYRLYEKIFAQVVEVVKGKSIIVVPDGKLNYIPFEVLLTHPSGDVHYNFDQLPWLLKAYPISYAYSATQRFLKSFHKHLNNSRLVAFAPDYQGYSKDSSNYLPPLKGIKKEAENICEIFNGNYVASKNASERNFKTIGGDYQFLHLAMHSSTNDTNPLYSNLVFTSVKDSTEDGFLNVYEIYNMNLNADMAVLSACNTGNGTLMHGEGVMSIARSFLYAGCPSVVMSLWVVQDNAGQELMTCFYKYLKKGYRKDKALQLAKLEYMKNADVIGKHPYYWSNYVVIGDTSPVKFRNTILQYVFLAACILFLLLIFMLKRSWK
jgi:CHAT domain-containing protein